MLYPARIALVAIAAAVALSACSSDPSTAVSGTPAAPDTTPGPSETPSAPATPNSLPTPKPTTSNSLDAITVTGKLLEPPKIEFKKPFFVDETRSKVVVEGKGAPANAEGYVTVHYYGVNARTGVKFDDSFSRGSTATFSLGQVIPGFKKGLAGQREGSRVLVAVPGSDGYDEAFAQDPSYAPSGYEAGDTLLFVVDMIDVSLTEATGTAVTAPAGLPGVSAGSGKPTITIPATAAPTKMSATVLIEGVGRTVAADDVIIAKYVGVSWKTGEVVDDGFAAPTTGELSTLIPGWISGLNGKKVGSRVLLVLPPADGFPEGSNNPPLEAGDTIVYVVDLLFASTAPKTEAEE